jgi:hypothetical protein
VAPWSKIFYRWDERRSRMFKVDANVLYDAGQTASLDERVGASFIFV